MEAKRLSLAALLAAGCSSGGGYGGPIELPLAAGLTVSEVALYQGVKVPLMAGGQEAMGRTTPVVRGRNALVRAWVTPENGWMMREVTARLELAAGEMALPPIEVKRMIGAASTESDLGSTINFEVPGETIGGDLSWAVTVREVKANVPGATGSRAGARFPGEGKVALGAVDAGASVKIVIVPIMYNADGSGRVPDTSPDRIAKFRDRMFALYPAPKIDITVRDPIPWPNAVSPFGQGWSPLLQHILSRRQSDGVDANVYYYGLFNPAATASQFCGQGCVSGLSALAQRPSDATSRGSIGLGFSEQDVTGTFVHEVGHAHGREHAPCMLGGQPSDPQYPHAGATIGAWGYDLVGKRLIDPKGNARDLMSYCQPEWVSDYTFKALFTRIAFVNGAARLQPPSEDAPARWRMVGIDEAGRPSLGEWITLRAAPSGEPREIVLLDAEGRPTGVATGHFYPFSHLGGGLLLVAEPPTTTRAIRVGGATLSL